MTPDVNVVIAAFRDDHPNHQTARSWLIKALAECAKGASFQLLPMVVASFLRLVTNAKIFLGPATIDEAIMFINSLLESPCVQMPNQAVEWPTLRRLCIEKRLVGNDLPDAWLAATVLQNGDHLVTFDVGFKKLMPSRFVTVLSGK